jgi:hypothetical protein
MIKSKFLKKVSGLPVETVQQKNKETARRFKKHSGASNPKPYPIPEEDSFTPPPDDSAEIKYSIKKNKA